MFSHHDIFNYPAFIFTTIFSQFYTTDDSYSDQALATIYSPTVVIHIYIAQC